MRTVIDHSPFIKCLTNTFQGQWRGLAPIPDISLEALAEGIEGEDVPGFLSFLRRILRWLPEERPTAGELMFDPWLMKGLGKFGQSN